METQGIDTNSQAPAAARPKAGSATEVFGDLLGKLFDRLAASPARGNAERELGASLFQAQSRAAGRDLDVEHAKTTEDRDPPTRARDDDDADPRDAIAVPVANPPHRTESGKPAEAGHDEKPPRAGTARNAEPAAPNPPAAPAQTAAKPAASGPAAPTAPAATAAPQLAAAPAAQGGAGTQGQISVTVTAAPAQAQPKQPLAADAALALQSGTDPGVDDGTPSPGPTVAASAPAGNAPGGSNGLGAQTNQGQGNQGQSGANPFPGAIPAANAAVAAQAAANTAKPFAVQLDAAGARAGAAEDAHPIFAAGQGNQAVAAAAAARGAAGQTPQLPRLSALDQIAINVQKALDAGKDKITIQLKPVELGHIDVTMETADDGRVSVHVRADRPETLDLLQRDARGLERALQDAGVRTDSGALSFGLRGENRPDGQGGGNGRFAGTSGNAGQHADTTAATPPGAAAARADGRVDLHV